MGKIADNKTRTNLTLTKEMKEKLTIIAKEQNRSLNNLIETILDNYIKQNQ